MLMFVKAYFFPTAKCPVWTVAFCIPLQTRPSYITHYLLQCHYQLKADDTDVSSLSFIFFILAVSVATTKWCVSYWKGDILSPHQSR